MYQSRQTKVISGFHFTDAPKSLTVTSSWFNLCHPPFRVEPGFVLNSSLSRSAVGATCRLQKLYKLQTPAAAVTLINLGIDWCESIVKRFRQ